MSLFIKPRFLKRNAYQKKKKKCLQSHMPVMFTVLKCRGKKQVCSFNYVMSFLRAQVSYILYVNYQLLQIVLRIEIVG